MRSFHYDVAMETQRTERRVLVARSILVAVVVILALVAGIFYDDIANLLENPVRLTLIVVGVAITFASVFMNKLWRQRKALLSDREGRESERAE